MAGQAATWFSPAAAPPAPHPCSCRPPPSTPARWAAGDDCVAVFLHKWHKFNKLNVFYGTVAEVNADGTLVINFDDGDELVVPWAACHLRDAPRPTFF